MAVIFATAFATSLSLSPRCLILYVSNTLSEITKPFAHTNLNIPAEIEKALLLSWLLNSRSSTALSFGLSKSSKCLNLTQCCWKPSFSSSLTFATFTLTGYQLFALISSITSIVGMK